ncbi:MAG: thymidine phosphorylase [Patescibacteria group bacterium]|nr:MAG: thymidine phosphorylase [Patescibacteria group bacterium]
MSSEDLQIVEIIQKKLNGKRLSYNDYFKLLKAIADNKVNEILMTYFTASTYKSPPSVPELYDFTRAMVDIGTVIKFKPPVADKHSTGGVPGNRVTMILVPIIAALGIKIPKTSSRAITSPAGTADCMEVLAKVEFEPDELKSIVEKTNGCVVWGGGLNIAPADDELISVEKPIHIESEDKVIVSILAKKLAVSATHLILDIPYSKTLKIKSKSQAEAIANKFKKLTKLFNIKTKIVINYSTDNLSTTSGPALESFSCLQILEQDKQRDLRLEKKALNFSAQLYALVRGIGLDKAYNEVFNVLTSGKALRKFKEIIKAQRGDASVTSESLFDKIKKNSIKTVIKSELEGKIIKLNNNNLSAISKILGAPNYKFAGIRLLVNTGEFVTKGKPVLEFYAEDKDKLEAAIETLRLFPVFQVK